MRPLAPKRPSGRGPFSWARLIRDDGQVTWRLYRRDQRGALHCELVRYPVREQSEMVDSLIAQDLKRARHRLRNTVDEIDLALMGVIQ